MGIKYVLRAQVRILSTSIFFCIFAPLLYTTHVADYHLRPSSSPTSSPLSRSLLPHAPPKENQALSTPILPRQNRVPHENMGVIPKDTPIEKVMEWVGYENPLIVRVRPEVEVAKTEKEKEIEIGKEFEEERA
ncbi:hypothetical protein BGX38DRAFT_1277367 [Terfezia claveryi]|nr:hypothetical protein BGX38DRAFT_1277367 [Terfezia claveryi]